jgi:hypothetical protein
MMAKGTDRARDTHDLERVEGGPSQDSERNKASKGHSLSGEDRGRVKL